MSGEVKLPVLTPVTGDPDWDGHYRKILAPLFFSGTEAVPGNARQAGAHGVYLVDARLARSFAVSFADPAERYETLGHSVAASRAALSDAEKKDLYEAGYALVADAGFPDPDLRGRLEFLLARRAGSAARSLLHSRLRERIEAQRNGLVHQNEFLHMAVHDLRSPLAAMVCYAELLLEGVLGNLEPGQLEPIRIIHRNCKFLIDMVGDLLDSARIEAGKHRLKLEKTDVAKEVGDIVESLKSLAEGKNIRIETDFLPVPEIYVDVQKFGRTFSNLLANAIKFTKANGKITVGLRRQENVLALSIQDTGPGMAAAELESIFEKFNTGKAGDASGKGHGLGLAICKSFVELHGGKLFVESVRHKGSVFIAHFPVEKRRAAAGETAAKRKILILDWGRDADGLERAGDALKNFHVEYASAAWPDWNAILDASPDFLVINEASPKSGFQRAYYASALTFLASRTRGVLLTESGLSESEKEKRRRLDFELLEKPCALPELFRKVGEWAGRDRRSRTA